RIAKLEQELSEARAAAAPERKQGTPRSSGSTPRAPSPATPPPVAAAPLAEPVAGIPPPSLPAPEGEPDDLKKIHGIGPGIEKTLHQLGIWHFRQIAAFTPENIAWVDQRLRFRGRIAREDWVGQARRLAAEAAVDRA